MKKSPFQRQIQKDFRTTFLNSREFGRVCQWNGEPLHIVEGALDDVIAERGIGVMRNSKRVYCLKADLPRIPEPDDRIVLDGEHWLVTDSQDVFVYYIIDMTRTS